MASPRNRQVTVAGIGAVEVLRTDLPAVGPDEVRVRSSLIGICGSDLHAAHGRHPSVPLPYQPGHEVVGVVESVGAQVGSLSEGDRVFLEPGLVCGRCRNCLAGRYNICQELKVFGCQTPGGMADYFVVAADRLHRVPDDLTDEAAVLIEPLSTPVHAVRLAADAVGAGDLNGRDVVVLGAGAIGLFTLIAALKAGARRVVVTDLIEQKRQRAVRLGATAALPADSADLVEQVKGIFGNGADVVFDCVAVQASVLQAVALAEKGGTVIVVGVPSGQVSIPLELVQDWEVTIRGALMYVTRDIEAAVSILRSGDVPVGEFITGVLPMSEAQKAFSLADSGAGVKVCVRAGQ
jgi:L-iditol 2-dehydrogenase